jgi:HSP20 family protein
LFALISGNGGRALAPVRLLRQNGIMAKDLIRCMQAFFLPAAQPAGTASWQPPADVYRARDGWLIKLDLAGVRPEEVTITSTGNHLTIHGIRRDWSLEEGCCHYQMEIAYNSFERTFTLPVNLEQTHVDAEHRHGMLLIHIRPEADQR